MPYSVDLVADETGDPARPFGASLLFLRWRRIGEPGIETYLETEFIAYGESEDDVLTQLRALPLHAVKTHLDSLLAKRDDAPARRWWDAMHDEHHDG